jgi:hypothetical protein
VYQIFLQHLQGVSSQKAFEGKMMWVIVEFGFNGTKYELLQPFLRFAYKGLLNQDIVGFIFFMHKGL